MNNTTKPIIGITGNYDAPNSLLAEAYYKSVLRAGGLPLIIPPFRIGEETQVEEYLDRIDAIIFSGGADINPVLLGEQPVPQLHGINNERDAQELFLMRSAYERQIPILGICRGIQVIAAALGGTVYQDIYSQHPNGASLYKHSQDASRDTRSHTVNIVENTILYNVYKKMEIGVNSFHHQAVASVPEGFCISATSSDGVIEAIESTEQKSVLGVQWHPESFDYQLRPPYGSEEKDVFNWIVDEAKSYAAAREVHRRVITLDSHCDTPTRIIRNHCDQFFDITMEKYLQHYPAESSIKAFVSDFYQNNPQLQIDFEKMDKGMLDAVFMVAYLRQGARDEASLKDATQRADYILSLVEAITEAHPEKIGLARTPDDIEVNKQLGRHSLILGIENGYAIGKDLSRVEYFKNRGVSYMTLCHNGDNDICDSNKGEAEHGGVSAFGEQVIREMNRTGMLIDLSHAADSTFYDTLRISTSPVVCTHSSSRALCGHRRNLTDEMMRDLARHGGVAQVTIYGGFLCDNESEATVRDIVRHLDHMVEVMGIDHVGIGTDFDGGGGVPGCNNAFELFNFTRLLLSRRYSPSDLRLLWGENFLRVWRNVIR